MTSWLPQQVRLVLGPSVPQRHRIGLLAAALAAILLFALNAWLDFRAQRHDRFERATSEAQKLLISFEDHAILQLDAADAYLRTARRLLRQNDDWRQYRDSLGAVRSAHASDFTGMLVITDRDGKVIFFSENEEVPEVSLATREYFQELRSDPHDRVIIDSTRRGRISGKMQYRLIRPLLKDGHFDGVILVTMLPENITRFYGSLSLGPRSIAAMTTTDFRLIARNPAPPTEAYATPIDHSGEWETVMNLPSGRLLRRSAIDGVKRHLFFSQLADYPVRLIVGVSEQDIVDSLTVSKTHLLTQTSTFSAGVLLVLMLILRLLNELNERRQAVWALQSLNKVHKVLSGSNQAVLQAMSEEAVYQAMCEAIVSHGGYRMAWVGLVQPDAEKSIRAVASAGHVDGYLDLPGITAEGSGASGPSGQAIRDGKLQVNPSFETNPKVRSWRQAALERGYRSSIGLPLKGLDGNFGVLNIYAAKADAFGPEEVSLFEELAADLSHGVMALRLRQENDLMSGALVQAQKMQALGNLTGGIAHDFNNMLQVILSNLEMAEKTAGDAKTAGYLRNALQGAENGAKLTGQLLAFARRQPLRPEPLRLDRLVEEMVSLLQRTLGANIAIITDAQPGLWTAMADANQLRNAILNLAINARDAMPDGGRLSISLGNASVRDSRAELKPGDYVTLRIADTGSGMSPEVLSRAFDPFFTTKPEGAGTGLGLSMVYGFAKQSGGHVALDSTVGLGSVVTLYLPRTWKSETATGPDPQPRIQGGNETILLVEDEDKVRHSVREQLEELGYHVLEADSGDAGLEILASAASIDLLFTDLVMPGLFNGRDLAIQGRSLRPGLKVLFTSGYARDSLLDQGHLDDGITLLGKPYRLPQLAEALRRALSAGPTRLLLVEDDQMIREAMLEILRSNGYEVASCDNAGDAIERLNNDAPFDAVIADQNLNPSGGAGASGLEVLQAARRRHPQAMLVLITGENIESDRLEGLDVTVLNKPFHPRALTDLLSRGRT